jgi:hypothetical protein
MSVWLWLVLLSLATFRLTRLVTRDDFPPILWARWRLQHAKPSITKVDGTQDYWWLGELVSCPWCASAYISGALVGGVTVWYGMPAPLLVWLSVWGAGALIADRA